MKKKIIGMFVCMLLIATAVPAVASLKNRVANSTVQNHPLRSMVASWTEMQNLLAPDGASSDYFGYSVSLSGDTALIGVQGDDGQMGSAYVFTRTGTTWTQQAKLLASDGTTNDWFGYSVSLSGDTALIGANNDDKGSAYVFTRTGTTWTQQAKLLASDGTTNDWFGQSVSLSGDTALIGAVYDDDKGSAYVFTRTGTIWTQQQKLLASDGAAEDYFGVSVSLSGETAIIGALGDADNGVESGSAYVFIRTGTTWTQQAKLLASDGAAGDMFGWSVSLDDDTALIGASAYSSFGQGSAYVFTRINTIWTQQQKLLASDGAAGNLFGWSVSLDDDTALIGATIGDADSKGSAYVFIRTGTTWTQQAKLLASDGAVGDMFGWSVYLEGDTALIGAVYDDDIGDNSGSAYVFTKESENQPPNPPTITGPAEGKAGTTYDYNFMAIDSDGDEVYYFIDWGDDTNSGWIGPYSSGDQITKSHTWFTKGSYTIKAKAKDIYDSESDWGTLSITIPKVTAYIPSLFLEMIKGLIERFPHTFPILRHLMGY